jgi:hypothetical protein
MAELQKFEAPLARMTIDKFDAVCSFTPLFELAVTFLQESGGLVFRRIHPIIPVHVFYEI